MSSRKKKQDRKKRLRKRQRGHPGKHPLLGQDVEIIRNPPGEAKMSEVLLEFLDPYSHTWKNEEQFEKLLGAGIIAWNAALYSGSKRTEFLNEMMVAFPPEVREGMRDILAGMIQRKETYFAANRRMIVDYRVTMTPDGPHLSVLSTFPDR
jgi:hypothetical protein